MKLSHPRASLLLLACLLLLLVAADPGASAQTAPGAQGDRGHLADRSGSQPTQAAPPPPGDCDDLQDKGERLACKAEKVHAGMDEAVNQLTADDMDLLTPDQKSSLRHRQSRSNSEHDRAGAPGHKKLAQRRESPCVTVEYDAPPNETDPLDDGNNDGACDPGELCAEVTTDGIGDDDGRCELFKEHGNKKVWEPCVETCRPSADLDDEADFDDAMADEAALAFDDASVLVDDLNVELRDARLAKAARPAPAARQDPDDKCENLLVGNRDFGEVVIQLSLAAAGAIQTTADVCADASRQSSGGFNWAAACIAPVALAGIAEGAHNVFELHDDGVTGDRLDATALCLEQMATKADANRNALDGLYARITEARERLEGKADEVLLLLNTPPGQRPDYPNGGAR